LARDRASLARSFTVIMTASRPASMNAATDQASSITAIEPV
jgi:hypothetical protein